MENRRRTGELDNDKLAGRPKEARHRPFQILVPSNPAGTISRSSQGLANTSPRSLEQGAHAMSTITTKDGTELYYKDRPGPGRPLLARLQ
jgi:hypothetical protein